MESCVHRAESPGHSLYSHSVGSHMYVYICVCSSPSWLGLLNYVTIDLESIVVKQLVDQREATGVQHL